MNIFFFFKQKTAYEMRISDWSSDVCSSDLYLVEPVRRRLAVLEPPLRPLGDLEEDGQHLHGPHLASMGYAVSRTAYSVALPEEVDRVARELGRASCRERVCQYV